MRSLIRHGALAAVLVAFGAACNAYDAKLLPSGDSGGGNVRRPVNLPPRPSPSTDGDDGMTRTIALRGVVLDMSDDLPGTDPRCGSLDECRLGDVIGLNLDGFLTDDFNGLGECRPQNGALPQADGVNGIDNFFGREFFSSVALVLPTFEADARAAHQAGEGTIVILLSGWNGTPNDYLVRVVILQAIDGSPESPSTLMLMGSPPELVHTSDMTPAAPPAWNGSDRWWVRRDNFTNNDVTRPIIYDDNAWVTNGQAVLKLPDRQPILFFAGMRGVPVLLTEAYAIATLSPGLTGALDEIVIAGRWHRNDLLSIADFVGVCPPASNILDTVLANRADVRSQPVAVGAPIEPGLTCDAVSMATLFDEGVLGVGIELDPSTVPPQLMDLCP